MCAADLAMACGLLVLAVHAGLSAQRASVRLREDAAARAPGGSTARVYCAE
jgi:hypothetical protein